MLDPEDRPLFDDDVAWEIAQAELTARDLGDGHPLVPPTRRRYDRMLSGVADPARVHGNVPPMFGDLTPELVAYNCVLAGCEPAELPVVLTAVAATLSPDFNLLGVLTTTGTPAVATIVHGPIAETLGMTSGTNCLGPGNRANACIGRAIALCLLNIGGARPGVGDMATMGQPGKYGFCFAEGDHPMIPPLHVRRGFDADESAVTVLGVSGTEEVLPADDRDTPEDILRPVLAAMLGARYATVSGRNRPPQEQFVLLPPEICLLLQKHGWDLPRIRQHLYETPSRLIVGEDEETGPVAASVDDIHPIVTGGAGIKMTYIPLWMGGSRSATLPVTGLQ